ncbi:hypothetical protein CH333_01390 [candidate division WOR-3 bacterium JGI_Cruoil_03_44_89]|uniref:Uncharacterized protein n=1 Tax=candidate division WOR-3 bacterium JGI_Cruoil_03_44_89 TaxID=1973748 RepID=A0A235BYP3_UNCW3|nr:MAG: hypothetical protein CH333_01390 [candidate division WOR-3 bacterium JGI_Cruoil_03_44_89]
MKDTVNSMATEEKPVPGNRRVLLLTALERSFYSSIIENYLFSPAVDVESRYLNVRFYYLGFVPITMYSGRHQPVLRFREYRKRRRVLQS